MSEIAAIEFANSAFYNAFASADLDAMAEIWARDSAVFCTHPGQSPILGRDEVIESWSRILSGRGKFPIRFRTLLVELIGTTGIVHCYEAVGDSYLAATNLFVKEGRVWRICHHHSGPIQYEAGDFEDLDLEPGPAN